MLKHFRVIVCWTLVISGLTGGMALAQTKKPGGAGSAFSVETFRGAKDAELKYSWLTPLEIKQGEKYPLVLCLHGSGGNTVAADVLAGEALRKKYPCFVMAPESLPSSSWAHTEVLGRKEGRPESLPLVVEAIQALIKKEPIDPARVYVTGQSLGGIGSWGAAARYPDLFAAAVPVCGAWKVEEAAKMVPVPIWAFHGEKDATVPVKFSRELTDAVEKAGGTAKYTEYAGVGHGSWGQAYAETGLWEWLFQQRKGPQPGMK